jgi:hypothetical protein
MINEIKPTWISYLNEFQQNSKSWVKKKTMQDMKEEFNKDIELLFWKK